MQGLNENRYHVGSTITFDSGFLIVVTEQCSLGFRSTFPNLFIRNLVRDFPYSHVLEDSVTSTTPSFPPASPISFCVFGNNSFLCPVLCLREQPLIVVQCFMILPLVCFSPLDLWKHHVMKENFSVSRPQIVEKFIQRLMESYQDGGLEVCIEG